MLALICGAGALPAAVAAAQTEPPVTCALEGFAPEGLEPDRRFRIETLGSLITWLRMQGVTQVCLCGHIRRPKIDASAIDAATMPLVGRLQEALTLGDDGALRVVLDLFEASGFEIVAAHRAAPGLLPPSGVLTRARPGDEVRAAVPLAQAALDRMGAEDLGQACVIRNGAVMAHEDDGGTDAMLAGLPAGKGGVLFKGPKPGQDRRADLPVIGPGTADAAARAGLCGIVIEAGGVMVLERAATVAALDRAGLFLWVRP